MSKLAVYPYTTEFAVISRHVAFLPYDELVYVMLPSRYLPELDAAAIDGGPKCGQYTTCDLDSVINDVSVDAFFLTWEWNGLHVKELYGILLKIEQKHKKIYMQSELYYEFMRNQLPVSSDVEILKYAEIKYKHTDRNLYDIRVPVLFIAGTGENASKFDMQLYARNYFIENKYRVCQLGSKSWSSLFGFSPLPGFMFSEMRPIDKAVAFNHYVYSLVQNENPDIVLIGVPGGIMPISDAHPGHLGELAYVMMSAIRPDALALTLYSNKYDAESLLNFENFCLYKFGITPSILAMSQIKMIEKPRRDVPLSYLFSNHDCAVTEDNELNKRLVPIYNHLKRTAAFSSLVDELSDNIETI